MTPGMEENADTDAVEEAPVEGAPEMGEGDEEEAKADDEDEDEESEGE